MKQTRIIIDVWREDDWVYKRQPLTMTETELYCLQAMQPSGYVPKVERVDLELIRTRFIPDEPVTHQEVFWRHYHSVLAALDTVGIRHGDLTDHALRVRYNRPYLIDFAESRPKCSPIPDKRPEGDAHWLGQAMLTKSLPVEWGTVEAALAACLPGGGNE